MSDAQGFTVYFSGAKLDQLALLADAEPGIVRFPSLADARFFAQRTRARGGTVLRIEGPGGVSFSSDGIDAAYGRSA